MCEMCITHRLVQMSKGTLFLYLQLTPQVIDLISGSISSSHILSLACISPQNHRPNICLLMTLLRGSYTSQLNVFKTKILIFLPNLLFPSFLYFSSNFSDHIWRVIVHSFSRIIYMLYF